MDFLIEEYASKIKDFKGRAQDLFERMFGYNTDHIDEWLNDHYRCREFMKNDDKAYYYLKEGLISLEEENYFKAVTEFTGALIHAKKMSQVYFLALYHRSAGLYQMKQFEPCLLDCEKYIESPFRRPGYMLKISTRQILCLYALGRYDEAEKNRRNQRKFRQSKCMNGGDSVWQKKEMVEEVEAISGKYETLPINKRYEVPYLHENENFLNASDFLEIRSQPGKGRHVVAKDRIPQGKVLFVEEPFIAAPLIKENWEYNCFKCSHCWKDTIPRYSCDLCTQTVYCCQECKDESWEIHMYECKGTRSDIWRHLGPGQLALRGFLERIGADLIYPLDEATIRFGSRTHNNYAYFNILSHTIEGPQAGIYALIAVIIIKYLKSFPNFFKNLYKRNKLKYEEPQTTYQVGAIILEHIAQVSHNSTLIEHWAYTITDQLLPDKLVTVGAGVYLSVSMMNHSCLSNVTHYFVADTIVVKAARPIKKDEEIVINYDIEYTRVKKESRQLVCKQLYNFECTCYVCSDPLKEHEYLNSFKCPECNGKVPNIQDHVTSCLNCRTEYDMVELRTAYHAAHSLLQPRFSATKQLTSFVVKRKILNENHKDLNPILLNIFEHLLLGTYFRSFTNRHSKILNYMIMCNSLWLKTASARYGPNTPDIGRVMIKSAIEFLARLTELEMHFVYKCVFLRELNIMIKNGMDIIELFFPLYFTKMQYASAKIKFVPEKNE